MLRLFENFKSKEYGSIGRSNLKIMFILWIWLIISGLVAICLLRIKEDYSEIIRLTIQYSAQLIVGSYPFACALSKDKFHFQFRTFFTWKNKKHGIFFIAPIILAGLLIFGRWWDMRTLQAKLIKSVTAIYWTSTISILLPLSYINEFEIRKTKGGIGLPVVLFILCICNIVCDYFTIWLGK